MKHKHHIIPKHAGGSNDASNLIVITVEDHAAAHKLLFEQYGRWQDRIAWLGLSGQKDKKTLCIESSKSAWLGKHHDANTIITIRNCALEQWKRLDDPRKSVEHRKKVSENQKVLQNLPEIRKKRSDTLSKMWELTDPSGNIFVIKNLQEFCVQNNLMSSNMKKVANGIRNHHKNWKCKRLG